MSIVTQSGANISADSSPDVVVACVRLVESTWQLQYQDGSGRVDDFKTSEDAVAAGQAYADRLDALPVDDGDRSALKQAIVARDKQIEQLTAQVADLEAQIAVLTKMSPAGTEIPADTKL